MRVYDHNYAYNDQISTTELFQLIMNITEKQTEQYHQDGYCIIRNAIPKQDIDLLHNNCYKAIDAIHDEMDRQGEDIIGITHRNKRYFVNNKSLEEKYDEMNEFIFGDVMAEITSQLLGPDVYLFNEQFVVKSAHQGMSFSWHQDSGYVGHPNHTPYLTCWIPLVDVDENNGTVFVLPFDQAGTREFVYHTREDGTNDNIGYHGENKGFPVCVNRGDIVCFTSLTFHRSGANRTDRDRPVFVSQYSPDMIKNEAGTELQHLAVPFIKNNQKCYSETALAE